MSDVITFTLPDDVSKEEVREEADDLGYASVNQYMMDVFEHREEVAEGSRMDRFERQLKRQQNQIENLEDRVSDLESE